MQEKKESASRLASRQLETSRPTLTERQVGVRGCLELILKLIIALILIGAFIANWLRENELNLFTLILLIILIVLLIWLILRQRHFVLLNCDLTKPTDCVHGDPTLLATYVLEPIVGTASGIGFSRYELEVVYAGASIPAAVIYANLAGNPDTTLTFGNHQVNNGTLGFVDVKQAVIGAGVGFLTNANFEVRLHVIGINGSRQTCLHTFQIASARSFIKKVGTAWAHNVTDPNDPLCAVAPPLPHALVPASVGGDIYVRGAANAYGCAAEKIAELHLWAIPDPTFSFVQPANGTPSVVPAGGVQISEVFYTNDAQRTSNSLDGTSDWGDILTYAPGWTTRTEWIIADLGIMIPITVPDIVEIPWPTGATSGKYTLLLEVKDTVGNTYYDIQRVWVDNDVPTAKITSIGGVAACVDLKLSTYIGTTAEICGLAWDPPIRGVDPQTAPNDNFSGYSMSFQKNGGSGGTIPVATPGVRVPNIWPGPLAATDEGVLANWDIVAALDGGLAPGPEKLARGERCAYVIGLGVSDNTLVGEGPSNHYAPHLYAINIINDIT